MNNSIALIFSCLLLMTLTACGVGQLPLNNNNNNSVFQVQSFPISHTNPNFRTCVPAPQSKIVHYPMEHMPPNGQPTPSYYEAIAKSQFQILHTIYQYKGRIAVFEESVQTDHIFTPYVYSKLKFNPERVAPIINEITFLHGRTYRFPDLYRDAWRLFGGSIPQYYEQLNYEQKEYLVNIGGAYLAYFLGIVPELHKVIRAEDSNYVINSLIRDINGNVLPNQDYLVLNYRENALRNEVIPFYNTNFYKQQIIFITYGSAHNFSDEFRGYPFERLDSCTSWKNGVVRAGFTSLKK